MVPVALIAFVDVSGSYLDITPIEHRCVEWSYAAQFASGYAKLFCDMMVPNLGEGTEIKAGIEERAGRDKGEVHSQRALGGMWDRTPERRLRPTSPRF
jgi:hypothetical protein